MKRVVVRAPLISISGYGVHSRQIFRYLNQKYENKEINLFAQPVPWGMTTWMLDGTMCDGLIGKVINRSIQEPGGFDLSFQVQLPNEWDTKLAKVNIGITAGVETDKCNPKWIEAINKMDLVIVPSNHVRRTFMNSGELKTNVVVIPEAFPDELLNTKRTDSPFRFSTKFNFLIVSQLTASDFKNDRKNVLRMVKWLCQEFDGNEDVGIVLKTNAGRNTRMDRYGVHDMLKGNFSGRKNGFPKIHLVHGSLTDEEMANLYHSPDVKVFVSATSAEGFGLPLLEAAASGLPVIATNWSGHLDFLGQGRFIKLDYELKELNQEKLDDNIFIKGSKWANPSERDFKKKVAKIVESYETPKQWATQLQDKLLKTHNFESVSKLYDAELLGRFI